MAMLGDGLLAVDGAGALRDETSSAAPDGGGRREVWVGALILILGAWGAGVAYFGTALGIGPTGWQPWRWTTAHTVLNLAPGAVAMAGGLVVLMAGRTRPAMARVGGLVTAACGAWFVIGAAAYPLLMGTAAPSYGRTGRGSLADLAALAGYGRGVGVLLAVVGGLALARTHRVVPVHAGDTEPVIPVELSEAGGREDSGLAPVVPAPIRPVMPPGQEGWRPQFRTRISRMVPRPAGAGDLPAAARAGGDGDDVLPRNIGVMGAASGPGTPWRPRFAASAESGAAHIGSASRGGGAVPPVPRSVLGPGEWLVASFPGSRLAAAEREAPDRGTAVVTNRRVIFAPEDEHDVREWSLDTVNADSDRAPAVVDLRDDAVLDLTDSASSGSFAAAVHAACSARQGPR